MTEATGDRRSSGCGLMDVMRRFRPTCDHLAAAHREVLLAAKSALETQVELLDEWRRRHTPPEKVG